MAICVHGDVCRAWMGSSRTIGNYPLSMNCPHNCPFFEEKYNNGDNDEKHNNIDNPKSNMVCVPRSFSKSMWW